MEYFFKANRKCIWKLFTLTVWESMWDEWVLLFSRIMSPWMLPWGAHSSRALGTRLVWVAVSPLPEAQPRAKFFLKLVNSGVTASFVFIISACFSTQRTSLFSFSLTMIILGKTMSTEWGTRVALSRLPFSAFEGEDPQIKAVLKLQRWDYPRWKLSIIVEPWRRGEGNQEIKTQCLAFTLTSCVHFGKLLVLSEPRLPHL